MSQRKDPAAEVGISLIASGTRISGEIESDGVVKIEGSVVGNVRAGKQLLIAQGGTVEGDIETAEAIVGGEIRGTIQATRRVEIQAGAVVHGDVIAPRLLVQDGGELNGYVKMARQGLEMAVAQK